MWTLKTRELVPNLCYLKPVTATDRELGIPSRQGGGRQLRYAVEFGSSDPQTITVDLLDVYTLDVIALAWKPPTPANTSWWVSPTESIG